MEVNINQIYSEVIHKSRYARYLPNLKRRENWSETINRYNDFWVNNLDGCNLYDGHFKQSLIEIKQAIHRMDVMPSMRSLMTAGPALERDNVCAYNCFSRDTEFVTDQGIKSFEDFEDGDTVNVLAQKSFKPAIIKKFGVENLYKLVVTKGGRTKYEYLTTLNHRWIVADKTGKAKKEIKTTKDLKNGDVLKYITKAKGPHPVPVCDVGLQHGMVFGDGTYDKKADYCKIQLCGDSIQFENIFPKSKKIVSDKSVIFKHLPSSWKKLPDININDSYLLGFIIGWFGADGHICKPGSPVTICNSKKENLQWFRSACAKLGIFTGKIQTRNRKNPFNDDETDIKPIHHISIYRDTLPDNFFIKNNHIKSFKSIKIKNKFVWKVVSIEKTDLIEDVWCVHEPKTETFTLANGIQTKNCSYVSIDKINKFSEILYILMCGTGAGFSVEDKYICKLPEIPEKLYKTDTVIVVADTKIGWAKAYRELLVILYSGLIPKWDLSRLRPAGAPLKTFGGRSSGPEPLEKLFQMTVTMFKNAVNRRLYPIECHDLICHIGNCVVVGGVRRSALISLSDLGDKDMRDAKSGSWWIMEPQRSLANNSAVYDIKPRLPVFLDEWQALYQSQSGERGIFNRDMAIKKCKDIDRDVLQPNGDKWEFGTNPCGEIILRPQEFCVTGDTPLITKQGIFKNIKDLESKTVDVWNGKEWSEVIIRKTRNNEKVVRVTLSDGSYLDCTTDHKFSVKDRFLKEWNKVEAKDLMSFSKYALQFEPFIIDDVNEKGKTLPSAYTLGFAVGDGCVYDNIVYIDLYGDKDIKCPVTGVRHKKYKPKGYNVEKQKVRTFLDGNLVSKLKTDAVSILELSQYKKKDVIDFISGWADADGAQSSKGIRIYLSDEHRARCLQLLLTRFGIKSSVNLFQKKGIKTNLGIRKKDLWYIQITKTIDLNTHRLITENEQEPKYKSKYQNIKNVELLEGKQDVYCFVEYKRGMAVFNNILTYQCNLSELVGRHNDDYDSLAEKVRISTIIGTLQSSLTNFKYLSKEWKKNCEDERLLGVSITGICDNPLLYDISTIAKRNNLADMLQELKGVARKTNKEYAERLGIKESAAITTLKPSGTVSQLVNSSSGIHPRYAPYYIRRIRNNKLDPLSQHLVEMGIPNELREDENNYVFSFPMKTPETSITTERMNAMNQLELWKMYADNWCEHNPSCTVYYNEDDFLEVGGWVYKNFNSIAGISFLPIDDHTYEAPPLEKINKREYDAMVRDFPEEVNFEFGEELDNTIGSQEMACKGNSCEII